MASRKITRKWDAELRRKQKERARAARVEAGRRVPAPVVEETARRTGAPVLESAEAAQ